MKEVLAAWGPALGAALGLAIVIVSNRIVDAQMRRRQAREQAAQAKAKRRQQEMLLKLLETMTPAQVVDVTCKRMEVLHYHPGTTRMRDLTPEEAQEFEDTYQVCFAALRMLRDRDGSTV